MAFLKVKNLVISTLASGISDSDLSLTVATGEGALFPTTGDFHLSLDTMALREIVKCTSRTGDVCTIVRAQEGTAAAAHTAGKAVKLGITAGIIENIQTEHDTHASRHEFGGADAADFTDWIKSSVVLFNEVGAAFGIADLWTQAVSAGMTFTQALVGSYFLSDATAGRTGYLYTTAKAFVYDWFKWIAFTNSGATDYLAWLWVSSTNGQSLPSSAQKCAGFRLEDGVIYAYSADSVAYEETNLGALGGNNTAYLIKNNADSVQFYLDGVLVATHSTRYPGPVVLYLKCYMTNKAAVAKNLYIRSIAVRRT